MPIRKYPFLSLSAGNVPRPFLPIQIINPHTGKSTRTFGLIDTGADDCALPAQFAALLGHDLLNGVVKTINTGNGGTNAYAHTTRIDIFSLNGGGSGPVFTINDTPIDFMPNLNVVLLGVRNFLGRFVLEIDYPNQVFSIRQP